tara:strand:+ start:281 stop:544 length:264 start_codon:yes stop_codon:yes gene_type:complete
MTIRSKGEAMGLVLDLKNAIKQTQGVIERQWYNDNTDLVNLKKKLEDRLREIEELIANGELPEVVIEEWEELTDDQLKLLGIKKIVL